MLLQKGDSNSNVKCLQQGLRIVCINPKGTDGIFGDGTESAVKRFQTKSNVSYTEQDMKRWWNEKDLLGFDNEKVISKDMSADDTVKMILKNCTKNIS